MSATPSALDSIRAEVRGLDRSPRALRLFGLTVGGVLLGIAGLLTWRAEGDPSRLALALGGVGIGLLLAGWAVPRWLKPVHRAWMTGAFTLGFVMTRVLLTLTFVLIFLPTAAILRLMGNDLLRRRLDPDATTYWIPRDERRPDRDSLERYF